jgi:hypothetical protein
MRLLGVLFLTLAACSSSPPTTVGLAGSSSDSGASTTSSSAGTGGASTSTTTMIAPSSSATTSASTSGAGGAGGAGGPTSTGGGGSATGGAAAIGGGGATAIGGGGAGGGGEVACTDGFVRTDLGPGDTPELAIDDLGQSHVVFYDLARSDLRRHVVDADGTFVSSDPISTSSAGVPSCSSNSVVRSLRGVGFDDAGRLHVVHGTTETAFAPVRHAVDTAGGWQSELVPETIQQPTPPAMISSLDGAKHVHVGLAPAGVFAAFDRTSNFGFEQTSNASGSFTPVEATTAPPVELYAAAMSPDGRLAACTRADASNALDCRHYAGDGTSVPGGGLPLIGLNDAEVGLAFDGVSTNEHFLYAGQDFGTAWAGAILRYTRFESGAWTTDDIPNPGMSADDRVSLALDANGFAHGCYLQVVPPGDPSPVLSIAYVTNASGAWTIEEVDTAAALGSCEIKLDASGSPRFVYLRGGDVIHAERCGP